MLKFRGAGQGPRALIAELVSGEIARALGLSVPELVFAELDPDLARTEPDPEIFALIRDSAGLNLALDYLPSSVMFDPVVERASLAAHCRLRLAAATMATRRGRPGCARAGLLIEPHVRRSFRARQLAALKHAHVAGVGTYCGAAGGARQCGGDGQDLTMLMKRMQPSLEEGLA